MTAALATSGTGHYKDEILDDLASRANIAQFASFAPGDEPRLRFARVNGLDLTTASKTAHSAVAALLEAADAVNVRSFDPHQPRSHEFLYGLTDTAAVVGEVSRLAKQGLHTIVNETIDVHDGGVSGVAYGGVIEFAPDDTPRAVEKPGTASLPHATAKHVLLRVYGFVPALNYGPETRVEFSIHPLRRGLRQEHTIVWEVEEASPLALAADVVWPNRFSEFLGDKAFGLLVADAVGLRVPLTRVLSRRIAPFEFGSRTGTGEYWIRTAPTKQVPGRFTTRYGWTDPFDLLQREDPTGKLLVSVLAQEGVDPVWSGAAGSTANGITVEGVAGSGTAFMQGEVAPQELPKGIINDVEDALQIATVIGPVRLEWVHDGSRLWVVQLHRGALSSQGSTIYPGHASVEHRFPVEKGLEALRRLVEQLQGTDHGIVLVGSVGVTSHFGDVLRKAQVPARIEIASPSTPN